MKSLTGKTAVITGAAGGIGAAIARALHARGCHLALVDLHQDALAPLAQTLATQGRRVTTHAVDVRSPEALDALAAEVGLAHGGVDILVNNAGVTVYGPFAGFSAADVDWLMDVNLGGVLHGCRAFLPWLRRAGEGHIVNLSSMAALVGIPNQSTYSASKMAVRGFSAALRTELCTAGIGVTAVLPGTIATPFMRRARTQDERTVETMSSLMQRYGTSAERVADRVVNAILRDQGEILVGWDSHLTAWIRWLVPPLVPFALRMGWRRVGRLPPLSPPGPEDAP